MGLFLFFGDVLDVTLIRESKHVKLFPDYTCVRRYVSA